MGQKSSATTQEANTPLSEKMAPRRCKLPTCQKEFVPKRPQDWKSEFCCREHQSSFWVEANRLSAAVIKGGEVPSFIKSEYEPGLSHVAQILRVLERRNGEWVDLRKVLPEIGPVATRVSNLRERGYDIECREVGERPFKMEGRRRVFLPGGQVRYEYRLVKDTE